jgi:tetratricopeptide (TPR) repeat protein
MRNDRITLLIICALVIGIYVYIVQSGARVSGEPRTTDDHYNLLVQGLRVGQLSLKKEAPVGLVRLPDPYNPTANARFRVLPDNLHDLSYYKGKLYLYYGITPALILFWPFVALTGHYLSERFAVIVFCAAGFLASVGLLRALWRRYFSEVSAWVVAASTLALGLATAVPVMLPRSAHNEVAVSCGYMLTMLALAAIWRGLHEPERRCRWLTVASLAYGLAVGARPSLLFGAVILLVPVAQTWRERKCVWPLFTAAIVPIALIGLGLMLYNELRFRNPFEFGLHYALDAGRAVTQQHFRLQYLWYNLRVYFLEPPRWGTHFPFVREMIMLPKPAGYQIAEVRFAILGGIPLVCLALAAPLAWRSQPAEARTVLRAFVIAVTLLFGACLAPLGFYYYSAVRYEVDFLPALVLLGVVGILGLERALANRMVARRVMRCWVLLLAFSVAFNLLWSVAYYALEYNGLANARFVAGRFQEAIELHQRALWLDPYLSEVHNDLGIVLMQMGKPGEAVGRYEMALWLNPNYPEARVNLGNALLQLNDVTTALQQYGLALRLKPDDVGAHVNSGNALLRLGKTQQAIGEYEKALRINPDVAEAHSNLGAIYQMTGKLTEAIVEYETALQDEPDYAQAHFNLGLALEKLGRISEAIEHYQKALQLSPDFPPAKNALARLAPA